MSDVRPSDLIPNSDGAFLRELDLRLATVRLSGNDQRVLAFIREHLDELGFHTTESIAQGANVSRAAVVRFSRRLGYAGFTDLRNSLRESLQRSGSTLEPAADPSSDVLSRKVRRDIENLELLTGLLNASVDDAALAIVGADTLWLLANRETHGLVLYLFRLLHHIRQNVRLVDPGFPDPLREATSADALLVCTFRPYSRQTIGLLAQTRKTKARIIVLTDTARHRFLRPDDIVLAVPVDSPTMFLSFTAPLCTLETLAATIARLDPERTYEQLQLTGRFAAEQNLMLEPGPVTGRASDAV